jgi:PAS domain S-box-containing protein
MTAPAPTRDELLQEVQALRERVARLEEAGPQADLSAVGAAGAQSFLAQLLRHAPAPIYVIAADGRYLFVNPAWEQMFGLPRQQVLGRRGAEVLPLETARRFEETNRRVLATGCPLEVEVPVEAADGARTYHSVKFPVRDAEGAVIAVGGVSFDVTERRQAEQALRESEARLRCFFEAAFEGLVIHEGGTILDANQAAAEMFGYRPQGFVGRDALDFAAPVSRDLIRERISAGDERPYETVGVRKDGSTFPLEVRGKNLSFQGRAARVTALRDLTELKRAERLLQEYAGRLQALSRRLLQVQERERQALSRELHDEVGQVLTGLHLTLELGERLGGKGLRQAVREARRMVQDLTARARDLSLRLRPTMLDDLGLLPALLWLIERYTAQARVRVAFHHQGLDRRLSPEGETAAYRIVQEALTNVARHAGVGEVTVRVTLEEGTLRIQVEDQGTGFDPDAALASGACCGLSGMRQRAALLGGRLTIESAPGAGTRLSVEWPVGEDGGEG